jgi:hypothetical protein
MLKSEMEQKKTSEPNRSSIFFENLPANIRKELDDIHLFELINRENQKFDASMLASANKLIQNYRKMISGLSYASHLDLLKELLMNPVKDYVSHFDEKGVGGAVLFSRLSPTTLKKKQAANELIDNISRSTEIEHLENILRDLPIPEQLSSISKKQPQLIVIRDELLCVLSEYKQSILESKLDMTSSSVATSVTTLFWNAPDSISRESRKGLIEP